MRVRKERGEGRVGGSGLAKLRTESRASPAAWEERRL